MADIRPVRGEDLDALHAICLQTGSHGQDATHLYQDPRIIGEIYAAPYAVLEPDLAFVIEDADGVGGYVLGTADTRNFEARCRVEWWPGRRRLYPAPEGTPSTAWTWDQRRAFQIHHPLTVPDAVVAAAPEHLHINLLPRLQGQGLGRRMIDHWIAAAGGRAHLGCDEENHRGLHFYDRYGFRRLVVPDCAPATVWMAFGEI